MRMISALYGLLRALLQAKPGNYEGRHRKAAAQDPPEPTYEAGAWYHVRTPDQRVIPAWCEPTPLWLAQVRDAQWADALRRMANRRSVALAMQ